MALSGIIPVSSGEILLDGISVSVIIDNSINVIGTIPHSPPLLPNWTIRDYVDISRQWSDYEIWRALEKCTMASFVKSLGPTRQLDIPIDKNNMNQMKVLQTSTALVSDVHLQLLLLARFLLNIKKMRMILIDESCIIPRCNHSSMKPVHELLRMYFSRCNVFIVAHHAEVLQYVFKCYCHIKL